MESKQFNTGDRVYTVGKQTIGRWIVKEHRTKTIVMVRPESVDPKRQVPILEFKCSELLDFEEAKSRLADQRIKAFEAEMKWINNMQP